MEIQRAFSDYIRIYPELDLIIDGFPATVFEPKLTLLENGLVVLLDEDGYWEQSVSAMFYSDDHPFGIKIPGAVRSEDLAGLVRRYLRGETGNLFS